MLSSRNGKIGLLVCAVAVVSLQLIMLQRVGHIVMPGYTSDDVAQQTIISQWQRGFRDPVIVGDDNWFIKYPLYWVTNEIPWSSETRAFATSWLLTVSTVVGTIAVLWLIADQVPLPARAPKFARVILPAVGVIALSPLAIYLISRINTRNIEIPLFLVLLYGLLRYERGLIKKPAWGIAASALIGILLADDPLFKFMVLLPIIVIVGARAALGADALRRWGPVVGVLVGGWVAAIVLNKLLVWLLPIGFMAHPQTLTSYSGFMGHIATLLSNDLDLFNANFWSRPLNAGTMLRLMNGLLLVGGLVAAWRLVKLSFSDRVSSATLQVVGLLPFWVVGVVLVSDFNADVRYLIFLPFLVILAIVVAAARGLINPRLTWVIIVLFVVSALSNVVVAAGQLRSHPGDHANADDQAIVSVLHQHHLTKGFATYWHANIVSFLSGYAADVIGIDCNTAHPKAGLDAILNETGTVRKPSANSFVLYYPESLGGHGECDLPTVTTLFGRPDEVIAVPTSANAHIAVYHHDITPQLIEAN